MSELRFAVAGTPLSTPSPGGTVNGLKRTHALGIRAMELEWVQQVPRNEERMREIRSTAKKLQMSLTVHAPYYINLNAQDPVKLAASKARILLALQMADLAGARSVCVHAAFYLGLTPEQTYDNVQRATEDILKEQNKRKIKANLGFETMGKPTQFGTLDEVLRISKEFDLYPVLDPAHMHARSNGHFNSVKQWNDMFDQYEATLGKKSLTTVHMHYSGIAYSAKGERKHLPLAESDAKWRDFLQVLHDRHIGGVVVCESPLLEDDTLVLQQAYESL